jgi:hypothetical protein
LTESSWLLDFIAIVLVFMFLVTLVLYVTYLFVRRLKQGEEKTKSFFTWLKHLFEIIMGL